MHISLEPYTYSMIKLDRARIGLEEEALQFKLTNSLTQYNYYINLILKWH